MMLFHLNSFQNSCITPIDKASFLMYNYIKEKRGIDMAKKSVKKETTVKKEGEIEYLGNMDIVDDSKSDGFVSDDGYAFVEGLSELSSKPIVKATATIKDKKEDLGKIILLKNVAGLNSGDIFVVTKVDERGNVYFTEDHSVYLDVFEKGILWKMYDKA